ncbi:hypothetical protein, partial [Thermoleptolyngbya sp. M55_K2018_002]|uniref:hypothetical protein n=1 Tax=Thermoleptolyngbya sp. M55_K2018_002 TaxID=2747808 RepID=UPI0025FF208D
HSKSSQNVRTSEVLYVGDRAQSLYIAGFQRFWKLWKNGDLHQSIVTLISISHLFKCSRTRATFWMLQSARSASFTEVPEPIALQSRDFVPCLEVNCKFLLKTTEELLGTIKD